jgi:hypothetical protein
MLMPPVAGSIIERRRRRMAAKGTIVPDIALTVLPFARIGTVVSSPCSRSAARTWASISAWSGRKTIAQAPTWSASVETLRSMPSRA